VSRIVHKRGMSVNVDGLDNLRKRLGELPEDVQRGARSSIEESAESVEQQMKDEVPVDTGTLRDAIQSRVNAAQLTADVGPMGGDAYYGYFVEFGTSRMPARPYATPAAEAERKAFPERLRRHVGDELK